MLLAPSEERPEGVGPVVVDGAGTRGCGEVVLWRKGAGGAGVEVDAVPFVVAREEDGGAGGEELFMMLFMLGIVFADGAGVGP